MKVVVVQNLVVPYELPLLESISKLPELKLRVYFLSRKYKSRNWTPKAGSSYEHTILPGITVELGPFVTSVNPAILGLLRRDRPDVLVLSGGYQHLTTQAAFILAKLMRIPIVYRSDEHGTMAPECGSQRLMFRVLGKLADAVENVFIRASDAIVCPGKRALEYNLDRGAKPRKIFISPYTTENDQLYVETSRRLRENIESLKRALGIPHRSVLLYVGSFTREKGIIELVDAFKSICTRNSDTAIVLLGTGPLDGYLKREQSEELHGRIFLPGFVEGLSKIEYYAIANALVFPTCRDLWGIVVNEAMCCALPIVTTKFAGAAEMVSEGTSGLVVDKASHTDLEKALDFILEDQERAKRMGMESLKIVMVSYNIRTRSQGFMAAIEYALSN